MKMIPYIVLMVLTIMITSFIIWRVTIINQQDMIVLHNTMVVTEIQIANDGLCMYQLSQPSMSKKTHGFFHKMKMKTACGAYNVNEQLILIKKSR